MDMILSQFHSPRFLQPFTLESPHSISSFLFGLATDRFPHQYSLSYEPSELRATSYTHQSQQQ
jgi:hypothetical protein